MQKVNLLPEDLAPPGLNKDLVLFIAKLAIKLGALVLFLAIILMALHWKISNQKKELAQITAKLKESDLLLGNVDDLKQKKQAQQKELDSINIYFSGGAQEWSKKLKQLSSLVPGEVWLKSVTFSRNPAPVLNIKGALISLGDTPLINTLSTFINSLKENKDFFNDFNGLLIVEAATAKKDNKSIMDFELNLPLK